MNPFKQLRQNRQATALAKVLARHKYASRHAAQMTLDDWDYAATLARVNAPSIETRALVIELLAQREAVAA